MRNFDGSRSVALFFPLILCGCTSVRTLVGLRVRLDKIPLERLEISLPKGGSLAPGESLPLVVKITAKDGRTFFTEGEGKGKVLWTDLQVTGQIVTVGPDGIVALPRDPRQSAGRMPSVTVMVQGQSDVHSDLQIPMKYDFQFASQFLGQNGERGEGGVHGYRGADGRNGLSVGGTYVTPGEDGYRGGNGGKGRKGKNGCNGPDVVVQLTVHPGSSLLLQASITDGVRTDFFLINPKGGSLQLKVGGGLAGPGGKGGAGGRGGLGGSGNPYGSQGADGESGEDGLDGEPGLAGSITVVFDPRAKPYLGLLKLSNVDGKGKLGSSPVFREESVSPLW